MGKSRHSRESVSQQLARARGDWAVDSVADSGRAQQRAERNDTLEYCQLELHSIC
jgi:hypothetical protein